MNTLVKPDVETGSVATSRRPETRRKLALFLLTVLGFSFWFWLAVPFASHRESYWWMAEVYQHGLSYSLGVISVTYRPVAQVIAWLGFVLLDPRIFPTTVIRQFLLQGSIWALFVAAWWLIFTAACEERLMALLSFVTGAVFFAGYVHLFHIYGIMYVPVMFMLGSVLRFHNSPRRDRVELWLGVTAIGLLSWHPFATALFLAYFCGLCVETFRYRTAAQKRRAVTLLAVGAVGVILAVIVFPRTDVHVPMATKLAGFLESYRSTEINGIATVVAFVLSECVVLSMGMARAIKVTVCMAAGAVAIGMAISGIPVLLLWLFLALVKTVSLRSPSLFLLLLASALLPYGAIIGAPVFALFAIIVGVYVTTMGCTVGEAALSWLGPKCVGAAILVLGSAAILVRAGVSVPVLSNAAKPLLSERERTYQLEQSLAWLHRSSYCGDPIEFAAASGSPIDSLQTATSRRHRPPASIEDVQLFWNGVLRCKAGQTGMEAVMTFGDQNFPEGSPVFRLSGQYAGESTVWIVRLPARSAAGSPAGGF
jgi:hypothetical protein